MAPLLCAGRDWRLEVRITRGTLGLGENEAKTRKTLRVKRSDYRGLRGGVNLFQSARTTRSISGSLITPGERTTPGKKKPKMATIALTISALSIVTCALGAVSGFTGRTVTARPLWTARETLLAGLLG